MAEVLIEVEDLHFAYTAGGDSPAVSVLSGVSLGVRRGEMVAVVGRNGSGKSTLARCLNALLLPQRGRVLVDGMDTKEPSFTWEIRRRVGMIFQNPDNQIVAATVEEDVAFGPENLGVPPAEIRRRVDEALAAVGMGRFASFPPHHLSGGQKQRVAIAGVLAMQPECIVLDEPTSMLDPKGRREVMATLRALRGRSDVTVVLITHRMQEAAEADRVLVMDCGRVVAGGPPRQVFGESAETLEKLGLELPPAVAVARGLSRAGLSIPPDVLGIDELVECLCPSS